MLSRLARFTSRCVDLSKKSVTCDPEPAVKKGDGGYADWVIVAIHGLREYLNQPYRRLLDILSEMPRITASPSLAVDELPDFTTVCTRKQDLEMRIWRVLLRSSASLHQFGEVQAIDATGFKRHDASRHYVLRVGYNFDDIKTTALVDCDSTAILDVHCSMKQPHDTQVRRQVLTQLPLGCFTSGVERNDLCLLNPPSELIGQLIFVWNLLQSWLEEPKIEDGDPWNLERGGMLEKEWTWFDRKLETAITDGGEYEKESALTDGGGPKDD